MPMETSILKSTKKILGLGEDYDAFDLDVITHINTAFFTLNQLGLGPVEGFGIEDDDAEWDDFYEGSGLNLHSVKTYVYLKVRLVFDPPDKPHHVAAIKEQIDELEHRLKLEREVAAWPAQSSLPFPP